ncbi:MAG: CapA family protein [bacterium]|nr:CapA family protein [bacterium]
MLPVLLVFFVLLVIFVVRGLENKEIYLSFSVSPSPNITNIKDDSSSMIFVGDIMLSRSVGDLMAVKNNYNWPFEKISDFLKSADLTFANLETPISNRGVKVGSIYSFRSNPKVVEGLIFAGFDVLSVANNHAWDYGRDAFSDTLYHLAEAGISYVGGGHNEYEAHTGVIKKVGKTDVGFLGYTNLLPKSVSATGDSAGVAVLDEAKMVDDIQLMKSRSQLVFFSFHCGEEYIALHNASQERIAHKAIDAGADLIIGHHPHVVEDIEEYKGKYIVYSLGNFVFDQNFSVETMIGLAVKVWLKDSKINRLEKIPIHISNQYQASL